MPDIRSLYEKDYLGQWDCADKDLTLTIANVEQEEIVQPKTNKTKKKVILTFKETPKKMVLNATNRDIIAKQLGYSYDHTSWSGKKITLYKDVSVKFAKEQVGGLRVRESATTSSSAAKVVCENCGNAVSTQYGMTPEQWSKYCTEQGKRVLCRSCIDKGITE